MGSLNAAIELSLFANQFICSRVQNCSIAIRFTQLLGKAFPCRIRKQLNGMFRTSWVERLTIVFE